METSLFSDEFAFALGYCWKLPLSDTYDICVEDEGIIG